MTKLPYSLPFISAVVASIGKLAPAGVEAEDACRKLERVLRSHLDALGYAPAVRKDGAKPLRLKWANKKVGDSKVSFVSLTSKLEANASTLPVRIQDCHDWIWDSYEFTEAHGIQGFATSPSPQVSDWIVAALADLKPSAKSKEEQEADDAKAKRDAAKAQAEAEMLVGASGSK